MTLLTAKNIASVVDEWSMRTERWWNNAERQLWSAFDLDLEFELRIRSVKLLYFLLSALCVSTPPASFSRAVPNAIPVTITTLISVKPG
jgi:hypothetical protein